MGELGSLAPLGLRDPWPIIELVGGGGSDPDAAGPEGASGNGRPLDGDDMRTDCRLLPK